MIQVYIGSNLTAVARLAQESETAWIYTQVFSSDDQIEDRGQKLTLSTFQLPWRSKDFKLSPFEDTCIGVQTSQKYKMSLQWKHVNYIFLLATLAGLVLFCMAPTLCRCLGVPRTSITTIFGCILMLRILGTPNGAHPIQEHLLPLHHWHRRRPPPLRPPPHFPGSAQAQTIFIFLGRFDDWLMFDV